MRRMKDSGIAWIGEIPEEWKTVPLARIIKERVSGNWGSEPTPTTDNIICIRVADFDFSKFSIVDRTEYTSRGYKKTEHPSMLTYGDILFEKSGGGLTTPVGRSIFFDKKMEATHSNFIDKLRIHDNYSKRFIFYYIFICYLTTYSNIYIKQTTGIQNFDLTKFLAKERICLPQPSEQHRIAAYLDAKCAEIDHSMELVRQGIDKLKEYKKSVITEAVTKGLDPDVPMKASGVPWIGVMPEGWDIQKIKFFSLIKNGDAIRSEELLDDGLFEAFGGNGKIGNCNKYNCDGNIFIIGRVGALCGNIRKSNKKIFISDNALILKIIQNDFDFIYFSLVAANLGSLSTSNAQPLITATKINNVYIALPPLSEQHRIAAYLDAKCAEIDAIIARKQELLDKLAAYKKSLIYECVTGKREVAA